MNNVTKLVTTFNLDVYIVNQFRGIHHLLRTKTTMNRMVEKPLLQEAFNAESKVWDITQSGYKKCPYMQGSMAFRGYGKPLKSGLKVRFPLESTNL